VAVVAADVADADGLARALDEIESSRAPLAGAVHLAGVLDDGVLLMQDWPRFRRVLAPKVAGAWNLHRAVHGRQLDFLVLFSSVAALTGSPGQSNYAAANAFLDALAEHRRADGLAAASLAWGPWAEVGMAARLAQRGSRRSTPPGVSPLALDDGLRLLGGLLAGAPPRLGIMPVDWGPFLAAFPPGTEPPLFAELAPARPDAAQAAAPGRSALLERLGRLPAGERLEAMTEHVRALLADVLEVERAQAPPADAGFFDLGLDSLMAVELRNRLGVSLGRTLPAALTFQFPHAAALAAHLVEQLLPAAEDGDTAAAEQAGELAGLSEGELLSLLDDELATLDAAAGSTPGDAEHREEA
jgi:acyl carrier protein